MATIRSVDEEEREALGQVVRRRWFLIAGAAVVVLAIVAWLAMSSMGPGPGAISIATHVSPVQPVNPPSSLPPVNMPAVTPPLGAQQPPPPAQ